MTFGDVELITDMKAVCSESFWKRWMGSVESYIRGYELKKGWMNRWLEDTVHGIISRGYQLLGGLQHDLYKYTHVESNIVHIINSVWWCFVLPDNTAW